MKRSVKRGAIAFVLVAVTVLLYAAASSSIFFVNQELTPDTVVYIEKNGFAFPFYKDGNANDEKAVKMVTVFHSVGAGDDNLASILFRVTPRDGYQLDSLHLEIELLQPTSALLVEDPGFDYQRTDYDSTIVLDFPSLGSEPSETVTLNFRLDLAAIDPATPKQLLLDVALTMHEDSVFKIVRYNASITIQLAVPSIA